jgi:hypothetical protein
VPKDWDLDEAKIAMTETTNRQRDNRITIRLVAHYDFGEMEGAGVLTNISYSGVMIQAANIVPEVGTLVTLYLYLKPPSAFEAVTPFKLAGHVARRSPTGFAINYKDNLDPDTRRMVDDAAALVAVPR